eukprot:gene6829-9351_t
MLFNSLHEENIITLLSDWLALDDICYLDTSLCNRSQRSFFLSLIRGNNDLIHHNNNNHERSFNTFQRTIYKKLNFSCFVQERDCNRFLQWIALRGVSLISLYMNKCSILTFQYLHAIDLRSIRSLTLTEINVDCNQLINIIEKIRLENLQELIIYDCIFLRDQVIQEILKSTNNLRYVTANGNNTNNNQSQESKLRIIRLQSKFMSDTSLTIVPNNIIRIDLSDCINITEHGLLLLLNRTKLLQYLSLDGCSQITDDTIIQGVSILSQLKHIYLHRMVSNRVIDHIATTCSQLENRSIIAISKYLYELKKLDVAVCNQITGSSIIILVENCKKLSNLIISDCWKITEHDLIEVSNRKNLRILSSIPFQMG